MLQSILKIDGISVVDAFAIDQFGIISLHIDAMILLSNTESISEYHFAAVAGSDTEMYDASESKEYQFNDDFPFRAVITRQYFREICERHIWMDTAQDILSK